MSARRLVLSLLLSATSIQALAHSAPHSFVSLDFGTNSVHAEMRVPKSELAFATAVEPGVPSFEAYLLRHVAAETPDGKHWRVTVRSVRSTVYLDHDYLVAQLELVPPAGASVRHFVLVDDAVTHEVRNHLVLVQARGDSQPGRLGLLQYPVRRLSIERPTRPSP